MDAFWQLRLLGGGDRRKSTGTSHGARERRGTRRFATFLLALTPLLALAAFSQPPGRTYRVGYIQTATATEQAHLTRAFEEGMRALGWVEGRNVVFERRFADGKQERLPELAAELVRLNVDVIVTGGNPVIAAAKQATRTIPIVMAAGRDPVGSGFIADLAKPGGNITGLTNDPSPDVHGKRLELLKEAVPRASRVAFLWNPVPPGAHVYRSALESAARKLGVTVQVVEVRAREELEAAFAAMVKGNAEAVVVDSDPVFFTARARIVELAARHTLPAIYQAREIVEAGGLMCYGDNVADRFRRAALHVDKILKGAKPGDLPVEQASRLELVINLGTARALGLVIPPTLVRRADEVFR
jgi:putative ABC transport system substrate-binding protein